jgi:RNA recognition motif-containing protein
MRIYVGSIPFETPQQEITKFLEEKIGPIKNIVYALNQGVFRGFVFVDFINDGDDQRAINELHNAEFKGRRLKIAEATPRPARSSRY